jgi:hypothetical protein
MEIVPHVDDHEQQNQGQAEKQPEVIYRPARQLQHNFSKAAGCPPETNLPIIMTFINSRGLNSVPGIRWISKVLDLRTHVDSYDPIVAFIELNHDFIGSHHPKFFFRNLPSRFRIRFQSFNQFRLIKDMPLNSFEFRLFHLKPVRLNVEGGNQTDGKVSQKKDETDIDPVDEPVGNPERTAADASDFG